MQMCREFPREIERNAENGHNVKSGHEYNEKSGMHNNMTWATEVEILVTAKCFRHDIFIYYNYRWQRYSYTKNLSQHAIYLNNRAGNHFNVVLLAP